MSPSSRTQLRSPQQFITHMHVSSTSRHHPRFTSLKNMMTSHYNDITWTSWRVESPATGLFVQQFIQADIKRHKLRTDGPLWGESIAHLWIPSQRASNAGNFSMWWRHHDNFDEFRVTGTLCGNLLLYSTQRESNTEIEYIFCLVWISFWTSSQVAIDFRQFNAHMTSPWGPPDMEVG